MSESDADGSYSESEATRTSSECGSGDESDDDEPEVSEPEFSDDGSSEDESLDDSESEITSVDESGYLGDLEDRGECLFRWFGGLVISGREWDDFAANLDTNRWRTSPRDLHDTQFYTTWASERAR
uniref:Uncharacterized protein n=1 Tax=Florenciella parvula TaxID=236787 RepID=A0A7S2BSN1_9STRA|mmetsp:Transcript_2002/g.4480  ORF Transcript_2002/g.4480 Transcript_2002/m.4480 type:complete len:126 (+) Transcript_2002:395-772(+)